MEIYVCPIGSGKLLNHIDYGEYLGVIAITEITPQTGEYYCGTGEVSQESQKEIFENKLNGYDYSYIKNIEVNTQESIYSIGSKIISMIDSIIAENSSVKFHFEIASGYKRISHILTLISYLRTQNISKLTFNDVNLHLVELPLISISLTQNEKYVLKEFYNNCTPEWNGKIGSNNFVRTYSKNRKYLYRIISKCKTLGLMNSQNRVTDFGRLYLEWC